MAVNKAAVSWEFNVTYSLTCAFFSSLNLDKNALCCDYIDVLNVVHVPYKTHLIEIHFFKQCHQRDFITL